MSGSDKSVLVEMTVADPGEGVGSVRGHLRNPSGAQGTASEDASIVSGTRADGTFQLMWTVTMGSPAGEWTPVITVRDLAGNARVYTGADLAALGLPSTITVTSVPSGTGNVSAAAKP